MTKQSLRTYLNDYKNTIKKLIDFKELSRYHLTDMLSAKIEFLGKVLMCNKYAFEVDNNSRFAFSYAILKLKSFNDYKDFITINGKEKVSTGALLGTFKNNVSEIDNIKDCVDTLNTKFNVKVDLDLYSDFRCKFTHTNKSPKIALTEKTKTPIYKDLNNYVLDCDIFCENFYNAIEEILSFKDDKIKNYLETNWLHIKDDKETTETIEIENSAVTGVELETVEN